MTKMTNPATPFTVVSSTLRVLFCCSLSVPGGEEYQRRKPVRESSPRALTAFIPSTLSPHAHDSWQEDQREDAQGPQGSGSSRSQAESHLQGGYSQGVEGKERLLSVITRSDFTESGGVATPKEKLVLTVEVELEQVPDGLPLDFCIRQVEDMWINRFHPFRNYKRVTFLRTPITKMEVVNDSRTQ